jgi:hypothetical protein
MVELNPFDVFDPPDTQVRAIGELFALAAEGRDVAGNAMTGLRTIMEASAAGLTGAASHVVDLAVAGLAMSVERISQHFVDDISAADVNAGLGSAGGILRTFALSSDDAEYPATEELLVWLDLVPILLSQMTGALHWQRIRARGHAYASAVPRADAATKH